MKKFELRMAIALMLITTIINVILLFTVELNLINIFIIVIVSGVFYGISNVYLDSYLGRHEIHHYLKGFDDAKASAKRTSDGNDDYNGIF